MFQHSVLQANVTAVNQRGHAVRCISTRNISQELLVIKGTAQVLDRAPQERGDCCAGKC